MLGAFFNPRSVFASTTTLSNDISTLQSACGIVTNGGGKIPFIVFDLAGGANLNGSEALIGGKGGQLDFLTTAGYGKLGLPGDMLPNSPNAAGANGNFVDTSLGLAWHSDGAILRGIKSMASTQAMANTNGAVIAAMSQNDTQQNPHNPMYGIYDAGANGSLLPLIGTMPSVSGGNSEAPPALINPHCQPNGGHQVQRYHGVGEHRPARHHIQQSRRRRVGAGVDDSPQRRQHGGHLRRQARCGERDAE